MLDQETTIADEFSNPLDRVEDVMRSNNWSFNRMGEDKLMVRVTGKHCAYRLFFVWQDDMNALQFCCQYDMEIGPANQEQAARSILSINEDLWMGHFDLPKDTGVPSFRHTCLLRGLSHDGNGDYIEDMVDIALTLCEQYYSAFCLLSHPADVAHDRNISLAMMQTVGEC